MKQKFGKRFILMPIGLFLISGTIAVAQFNHVPDSMKGVLMGIGIGLIALPLLLKKLKPTSC